MDDPRRVRPRLNPEEEVEAGGGGGGGRRAEATSTASPRLQGDAAAPASAVPPPATSSLSFTSLSTGAVVAATREATASPALVSARIHAFSSETWWMVDLEANPSQGATRLVKICMHAYGWDSDKARAVLRAYRQFFFLKTTYEDYDAKVFSPSRTVDMMWHQHILDVTNYVHDCALLCGGRLVGHDPLGSAQGPEREKRRKATHRALLRHKEVIGIEIEEWKDLFDDRKSEAGSAPIQLGVVPISGSRFTIDADPDGSLSDLYDAVVSKTGIPSGMFRLVSGARPFGCNSTSLRAFGLADKSSIWQVTPPGAVKEPSPSEVPERAIRVHVKLLSGAVLTVEVMPDSGRLYDICHAVQDKRGIPPDQMWFTFKGKLLDNDGPASLRALGLENESTIHLTNRLRGC